MTPAVVRSVALRLFGGMLALGALLFGAAGSLLVPAFWIYLGTLALAAVSSVSLVARRDPTLLEERMRPGPGGQDRHLRKLAFGFSLLHWLFAGLDVGRLHWSDTVPIQVQAAALAAVLVALTLSSWAVVTNRFFSPVVRIQEERGHHLVSTGPYALVRHPGYAGALLMLIASGPALGSWLAIVLVLPSIFLILRRLRLEDRLLHAELDGYRDYAERVRFRVLPGVW